MACQASARVARGWIVLSGRLPSGGLRLVIRGRGKVLSFWICLCFIFLAITAIGCVGAILKHPVFTTVFSTNTLPSAPRTERGAWRQNRGFLRGSPAAARLGPFLFLSLRSRRHLRRCVQHYLGPGSLALQKWVASGRAWATAGLGLGSWLSSCGRGFGAVFAGCWVGAILGRLEAATELERLGRKCRIAWDDFCAAVKRSAKPSTAGPNRPVGETGESRKGTLSASLISVRFSHRWRSSTTRLAMDLPIAWAVILVAHRARSVALRSSLKAAGFGLDSSMERRSFSWNTWRTAMEWSAEVLVQPTNRLVQRELKSSYTAWTGGRLLPSSQWPWAGRDARPLTHPGEAGCRILFLQHRRPKWGRRKKRHVGGDE